ncbi:MAG: 50S ribosomal protein L13 [Acidobacteria bacterium]|nr:50S ribosomal protein L13 [Acidobacteriota bacterium]MBI3655551.1 50S ribosomal protein L13 [Acidobacteriota bacterium]
MKTYIPTKDAMEKKWYILDAKGVVLGRLATKAARILMGKVKPIYTPFLDTGDFLIVINSEKAKLTGKKMTGKIYRHHTGYMGGLKEVNARDALARKPARVIYEAVTGMLPKSKLGRKMATKLRVYTGAEHPHKAQQPIPIEV